MYFDCMFFDCMYFDCMYFDSILYFDYILTVFWPYFDFIWPSFLLFENNFITFKPISTLLIYTLGTFEYILTFFVPHFDLHLDPHVNPFGPIQTTFWLQFAHSSSFNFYTMTSLHSKLWGTRGH